MLAQLREANFAAGEQRDKLVSLQTEVAGRQQQAQLAQQTSAELEAELALQVKQQQHLLDELSQSQVCLLLAYWYSQGSSFNAHLMHELSRSQVCSLLLNDAHSILIYVTSAAWFQSVAVVLSLG